MNIFDFAMNMEKEGEAYYRDLASKASNVGLARIFTQLADSEVQHYELLKRMKEKVDPKAAETDLLADAKSIFAQMAENAGSYSFEISEVELYKKAKETESGSAEFYSEKAREAENPAQSEIFERLAADERAHAVIMQNIIDFVSRPDTWLEDAEWSHMDAY